MLKSLQVTGFTIKMLKIQKQIKTSVTRKNKNKKRTGNFQVGELESCTWMDTSCTCVHSTQILDTTVHARTLSLDPTVNVCRLYVI